jgi:3',5'-cyclic AMP phosphodiesterase CpdA
MPPSGYFARRDFLRLGARAFAGAALAAPFQAQAARQSDDFSFVVANDLHYRDGRCGEWLSRVVTHIGTLRPRPEFVALAGDLSEDGSREQLSAVREIFSALPMPVRAIIGNHDHSHIGDRRAFEEVFGSQLNRRFECGDWQFLVLDTTQQRQVYRTCISAATLGWLDRAMPSIPRDKPLIVLTHFPLGRNWLRPVNARAVLQRLHSHELRGTFGGHWHGWTQRIDQGTSLTTGRCCSCWRENHDGSREKGYLVCRASAHGVNHGFVAVA